MRQSTETNLSRTFVDHKSAMKNACICCELIRLVRQGRSVLKRPAIRADIVWILSQNSAMAPIVKTGLIILLCNYLIASICGVEAHSDAGTITSDDPTVANLGQFPYQVSLQDWYSDVHFCSGAIITDQWVLTAASCIYGLASKKQIKAVVGTNQLTKGTYYKIRRAFTYQETDNYHRDIALLKTKSKMVFNENVSPIELPKQVARVNEKVVVSGWGNSVVSHSLFHEIFTHSNWVFIKSQKYIFIQNKLLK